MAKPSAIERFNAIKEDFEGHPEAVVSYLHGRAMARGTKGVPNVVVSQGGPLKRVTFIPVTFRSVEEGGEGAFGLDRIHAVTLEAKSKGLGADAEEELAYVGLGFGQHKLEAPDLDTILDRKDFVADAITAMANKIIGPLLKTRPIPIDEQRIAQLLIPAAVEV